MHYWVSKTKNDDIREAEKMKCVCGAELIWGGDHTFEDYGREGDGMVSNLSCSKCDVFVILYQPE